MTPEEFTSTITPYLPRLRAFAFRYLGTNDATDDAVNQALASAWERIETYVPEQGLLVNWLSTFVHRKASDLARKQRVRTKYGSLLEAEPRPEFTEQVPLLDLDKLLLCLKEISPDQEHIILHVLYGWTIRGYARHFNILPSTAKSRWTLALTHLFHMQPIQELGESFFGKEKLKAKKPRLKLSS